MTLPERGFLLAQIPLVADEVLRRNLLTGSPRLSEFLSSMDVDWTTGVRNLCLDARCRRSVGFHRSGKEEQWEIRQARRHRSCYDAALGVPHRSLQISTELLHRCFRQNFLRRSRRSQITATVALYRNLLSLSTLCFLEVLLNRRRRCARWRLPDCCCLEFTSTPLLEYSTVDADRTSSPIKLSTTWSLRC
nr:hypothetical protein Itr_chr12CG14880 [Ipomoea trifida]